MTPSPRKLRRPAKKSLASGTYYYFEDTADFQEAFTYHRKAAKGLADDGLHWSAFLTERFALECFLKDVYCVCRHEFFKGNPEKNKVIGFNSNQFKRVLETRNFGHDLKKLWDHLVFLLPELSSDAKTSAILPFIKSGEDWQNLRYESPASRGIDWQREYETLSLAFDILVKDVFKRLK